MLGNLEQMVVSLIESDPAIMQDPDAKAAVAAIKGGDQQALEQMGRKLSQRAGMSPQDLYLQGLKFIGV